MSEPIGHHGQEQKTFFRNNLTAAQHAQVVFRSIY